MRVNELAKEVGKSNKEIMEILNAKGANIKSHMSNVSEEQVALIKNIDKELVKEAAKETDKKTKKVVLRPQNAQQHNKKNFDKPKKPLQQTKEEAKQIPKEISRADVAKAFEKSLGSSNKMTETKAETKVEDIKNIKQAEEKKEETKPEGIKIRENVYANLKPRENVYANMNQKPEQRRDNRSDNRNDNRSFNRDNNKNFGNRNDNRSDNRNDNRSFNRGDNKNFANRDNRNDNRNDNRSFNRGDNKNFANRDNRNDNRNDNRSDNRNDNRNFNRDNNRNFNRDSKPNFRNQNGFANDFAKDKDEDSKPIQSRKQNVKKPAAPAMDAPLAKKTSSTRINKNNFKNQKNDKKHRTEDGPAKGKVSKHPFIMPVKKEAEVVVEDIKEIVIPENITIKDFASKLRLQPAAIVKKLFLKGQIVTLNSELSFEQAEELALEYDVICTLEEKVDVIAELLRESEEAEENLQKRPPVVCVMGHVDHGKTSLLDAIRHSNTTSHEAGGITQHIGAYMVSINDEPITFLDTPGHEAFTAMRMRGAKSTDIAILVVAADDGVMPQTIEAINHAKAAEVEIIVAINKVDKPSANIDRVKQELSEYELIPEDWGGSTIFCPVSAKTGEGISHLLEMIILAAEVKELKANADRKARGLVIEAELDKGKGPVATVLVQKGTLRVGDFVAAGSCSGKVRAMMNDKGMRVKEAGPSTPVEILGLDNVPNAGEVFVATENDKEAKSFAATFISENKNKLLEETKAKISLDDLFSQIKAGNIKELPIIIKADVQGSVEAVKQSLVKLSNEEVQVKVIHGGVGAINESDVSLAAASNAIIIGFNVRPDVMAKATADREKVDLRLYKVIYQAIEDVESAMKGMLEPIYEEKVIGHAEVRQIFKASGVGTIAGSYVLDGVFQRGCMVRITRDGEQIFEGNLASLKRFKDDVKEVKAGYECGLVFEKFNDLQEFDQVEAYTMVEVERK